MVRENLSSLGGCATSLLSIAQKKLKTGNLARIREHVTFCHDSKRRLSSNIRHGTFRPPAAIHSRNKHLVQEDPMKSIFTILMLVLLFALPVPDAHCHATDIHTIKPTNKVVTPATEVPTVCPNPKKLRGLCMFVDSKEREPNSQGRFVFKYQKRLLEAACADPIKDNEEEIGRKIAKLWKDNEAILICNNTKFDVANGNILKFAVNVKFDEFLIDLAHWKIDFNKVDETDGRTTLDYLALQVEKNKGLPQEDVLKSYYAMLRKAGAKHKSEL